MDFKKLVILAQQQKEKAYAPYSQFKVGAALLMESGKVYAGCNIENSSFGCTICAERVAISKAVSEGESRIKAIAIASDSEDFIYPCGICRQVIKEFSDEDTSIICSKPNGEYKVYNIEEIFPKGFKL